MKTKKKIIITGGGTGGHLYPALSVASAIEKINPNLDIHFVGSPYGLEAKMVKKYPLHLIPIGGLLQTSLIHRIKVILMAPIVIFKCLKILFSIRPEFVFGFGGYASGPLMLMAALMGKKTALFESNAIPGITNRILSLFVRDSFVTFEGAKDFLKSEHVIPIGFPIRSEMKPVAKKPSGTFRVLVFGGSQGARGINTSVSEALQDSSWTQGIEFVHQTGKYDFSTVSAKYRVGTPVKIFEYLDPIKDYYDWADVIFCRAGAGTIAEVAACGKAAHFIPFPFATDQHQLRNAEKLAAAQAALVCEQKDFTPEYFKTMVLKLKNDRQLLEQMENNVKKFHRPEAAEKMAKFVVEQE